ncbi:MAG: hypothetical protein ACI9KN_001995, partial [Gammaproteobacteria bacterium]
DIGLGNHDSRPIGLVLFAQLKVLYLGFPTWRI